MERFCHSCGSLVSGDGRFCTQCGSDLDEIKGVSLEKPVSQVEATQIEATPVVDNNANYTNNTYTDEHAAPYVNPTNAVVPPAGYQSLTLGQWVGTILLTSCLGIVSLILLFIWAFSDTPEPKKTFCRGMLIVQGIMFGLALIWIIICFAFAFSVPSFIFALSELG